ncbi:molybdopterin biosynthesis protein [Methylorubrum extorquens]|uniref:Molybdopterin molybdenumtransferase n=1 Tax=Methylorubrum extorquens (strain ATCC 14718 / DSM 1338 / JCM 2805 / NCIMB 9133 / AM1) TaxID=272630 RepID=C5AVW0_METEA|nr:molybdopterin biosynthesis protein [Methylorubrum extorquens]ACS40796.1 putative molybdopterin biosynthesis-related protein [Methylorubrum extorquens AM1]MCP1541050.1 putative molybdopterin biosynthesis protein [Methylorubrum extorquens]MCP1586413.1 putative molybdopterin biosynthesis protein [Methylorubrum extorquens]
MSVDRETDFTRRLAAAARQEQFLTVMSRDDAHAAFRAALPHAALPPETVPLAQALGRVLAGDIASPIDVPPFDRALVDGFALRAADTEGANAARPRRLALNREILACGVAPTGSVATGTATPIATGGMIPRGADAVVMVEQTEFFEDALAIDVTGPVRPGQFVGYAGADMASGETVLRKGAVVTAREIGMLAACGLAEIAVVRRPRVAVLSTGDELVAPGGKLRAGAIYDSNGAIVAASVAENGGEPVPLGIVRDDEAALDGALRDALAQSDLVVLSGGTSKGAGDVSHRILSRLGPPGILVHGVALKPGKPLCLAVAEGKAVVVLPGFPTSAMFTFHEFVVPLVRALAGLPPREEEAVSARLPQRLTSELGRTEFVMASLAQAADGLVALPLPKGSGSVTAFSQADGFFAVPAARSGVEAGETVSVVRLGAGVRPPDLTIIGSHCIGLDQVVGLLAERGFRARTVWVGSAGGLAALRRGECNLAAMHLLDPKTGRYNAPFLEPGMQLALGWRRLQGVVFRKNDARFEGRSAADAVNAALADPDAVMVNRNAGSGTRLLVDGLIGPARPAGFWNQPRSHNAVAAAVAQGRADWGVAIASVATAYGLGFLPLAQEHYDFAYREADREKPALAAFLALLATRAADAALNELGFEPGGGES